MKIYRCTHCGNIVAFLKDAGVPLFCCGQKMELLVPGSVDAAQEKHVPVAKVEGRAVEVTVGAVDHPMVPEHFIEWILLETDKGYAVHRLARPPRRPSPSPKARPRKPSTPTATCTGCGWRRFKNVSRSCVTAF